MVVSPEMEIIKDDVVISGIGGYFPKALNIAEFKDRLLSNESLLGARWPEGMERGVCNLLGIVPSEFFDNSYFGIHRQQCTFMDPMQRLVLERVFEALIDAGVSPSEVKGKRIGVFMGSAIGENDNLFLESVVSGFGVTGHSRAMMPNRVSYWLNLKGPSVAYDSNWVGGIEVLRLAYTAIKTGQCESVIVGTANLALNSEFQWLYNDMGLLSDDGSTKSFDAGAKGYARSDGVVVMYIQKASDARRCYSTVLNATTRFDGNREGDLLTINVPNMVEFLEEFYEKLPVKPEEVQFVEAYGCAQKEIDEKEVSALEQVYCKNNRKTPLWIGSVKTQTGHSEASASFFSIAKVIVAMKLILFQQLYSSKIQIQQLRVYVMGKLKSFPRIRNGNPVIKESDVPTLIIASSRTQEGIEKIMETIKSKPKDPEYYQLIHEAFSKPILGHLYRGYTILGAQEPKQECEYHMGNKRQTWFVYSGMGSQWSGMASDLMKIEVFANSINKSARILAEKGVDLLNIITTSDKTIFDNILNSFVGIAAIQIALTDVLKALGIEPDGIIGHSVGELGCAYADGCMTAEQMILSSYSRGRASLEATLIKGMMAAIGLGYNQIKDKLPPTIEVACHNGPDSCTISGPTEDMQKFVKELQDQGVFARLVNVANIAYHSQYIKPAGPLLLKYLKDVLPEPVQRSSKWISTSNLEANWNSDLAKNSSAEYHTNNLLSSVLFEEGIKHIPKDSVLIEIAPHGLLQAILKRSIKNSVNVPLTQRGCKSGVEFLLQNLGKLYIAGLELQLVNLYPKHEYPVSRGTPALGDLVHWNHSETWRTGLEDKLHTLFGVRDVLITLNSEEFRDCVGHQLNDNIVLPVSYLLNIVYQIISNISSAYKDIVFDNLHFKKPLVIPKIGSVPLHAMVQKGSGDFEILSDKDIIMTGRLTFPQEGDAFLIEAEKIKVPEENVQLTGSDVYSELQHRGHKYSGYFKSIKSLTITEQGSVSTLQWSNKWTIFLEAVIQQQLLNAGEKTQEVHIPKTIQKIAISQSLLPSEKTDIDVHYDYATRLLYTDGIQLLNMTTVPLPFQQKSAFLDSVESIPLCGSVFNKIEAGINLAIQLSMTNFEDSNVSTLLITEMESEKSLTENIKNVLSECNKLNANLSSVNDVKQIVVQQSYPLLLVVNDVAKQDILKLVASSHAFLLSKTDKSILSNPNIIQVAQFAVGDISYSILRKINNLPVSIIQVKGDTLSVKDLKRSSVSWVSELFSALEAAKLRPSSVFLFSNVIPLEGFTNFVQELRSLPNTQPIRVVFNLDKKSGDFTHLFKQNVTLTIIKDGVYSSYLPISVKFKENIQNEQFSTTIIKNKTINYIGLNLRDETLNPAIPKRDEVGNIDYSGVTSSGQRVMGLAKLDKDTMGLNAEPLFCWEIPEWWTLEDGASVPHAYVCAYYMLMIKARLQPGDTVLIHAGCSPVGLAAISIASVAGCQVYVTVSAEWQKAYLKKQFAFMKDYNIFGSDNASFEPALKMATGGKGAEVILNCLSGSLLQSSFACLADYGRFIQYGKYDLEEGNFIGMYSFLRNTSFYAVDLGNVFNQPKDVKEEINKLMTDGIERLVVRPLQRKTVAHQDVETILSNLKQNTNIGKILIKIDNNLSLSKLDVDKPNRFICDSKNSYLVYGGTSENWTNVTEWLVLRGARKIVVSSESTPQQTHINRRLSLLQTYYGVDIITAPNKAHTKEGAAELLSEVYFLGPIHAVFLLPNKTATSRASDIKPVQYIDNALRTTAPKALFINFINAAAGICQIRADAGFSTYNVQWDPELGVNDAISSLDNTLSYKVKNVLLKNDKDTDDKQENSQGLFKKLSLLLPTSTEIIKDQKYAPSEPTFVQIVTEGPREIRELAPIFIIPGLTGKKELDELAMNLLYPTFCAVLPSKPIPFKDLAAAYVQKMREIFPKGPYNIIAMSWGGPLAIEVARILHELKASIHLFLIDSAPQTLQAAIKHLGEDKMEIEINLLSRILKINDTKVLKDLKESPNWESRIKLALKSFESDEKQRKLLEEGLKNLKQRIEEISSLQPTDVLISGTVHLIRPSESSKYDSCGLTLYCSQTPEIILVNGDHISIIGNYDTSEYINKTHFLL
ncbi:hypothetical protein NQ317_004788 [Molorchus minor]|uniref:Uncharacterized protein n=1 Tax=Molorchus minor TaxID=1323400 RepID=A0ABQ9JSB8_9CUCU|nr:hypothetical protein NQ317_004788 [Molorchus minor]